MVNTEKEKTLNMASVNTVKQEELADFNAKVTLAILSAINDVEATSKAEKIMQLEYLLNLDKIMSNYEELRPVLSKFFESKK